MSVGLEVKKEVPVGNADNSANLPPSPSDLSLIARASQKNRIQNVLDQNGIRGTYPYSNGQGDPSFAKTGCGPTSMAMVLEYYKGTSPSQTQLAQSLGQQLAAGGYHGKNGTTWDGIVAVMAQNGVRGQIEDFGDFKQNDRYSQYKHTNFIASLKNHFEYGGGPVIVPLTSPSHILVVSGYEEGKGFKILDPNGGKTYYRNDLNSNAYIQFFK